MTSSTKAVTESKFPLAVKQNETLAELEIISLLLNSCDVLRLTT